jgi:prepilin-type N-terminal cleavage/methylation domain-containing protein
MMVQSPQSNIRGFSLVELLAAIAAISVVILGTMTVSATMVKTSAGAQALQQRTNLAQDLTSLFGNAENCTSVLENASSQAGTVITLPANMNTAAVLKRISIQSITLINPTSLGGDNYRALLNVRGEQNGVYSGAKQFTSKIPVYYSASGGSIQSCLSVKSPYATCLALNGTWKDTYCDFCTSLGGTRLANGVCSVSRATPTPTPVPPPTPTPTPTPFVAPTPPRLMSVVSASGFNGVRRFPITSGATSAFKRCVLVNYSYDGDGIGQCTIDGTPNGGWFLTLGDEGTRSPQVCYMMCAAAGPVDYSDRTDGGSCQWGGKEGVMIGGCCATGTTFNVRFVTTGGKGGGTRYVGTDNDIGCH